jgi:hypothetical protein
VKSSSGPGGRRTAAARNRALLNPPEIPVG